MIRPNPQSFCFDETLDVPQQQLILKDAAGEDDRIGSMLMAKNCNRVVKPFSNSALKCAGNFASIPATQPVANHFGEQRAEIQFTA